MPVYPYSNVKYKTLIKSELVKLIRKIAVAWEKKTGRNQDLSLDRLKEETIPELKKHMKWYTSKDAAKNWEELSGPSESATLYKVDEHEKGNDGNLWAVTQDKNGRKKWVLSMIHEGDNSYVSKSLKPSESATLYKVDEHEKGNDGNLWAVTQDKNGRKKWVLSMIHEGDNSYVSKSLKQNKFADSSEPVPIYSDSEDSERASSDDDLSESGLFPITSKSPKSKSNKKCQEGMLMNAATGKCRKNCAFHGMVRHRGSTRCSKKLEKCPPGQTRDSNSKKCRKPLKCPKGHRKDSETGECIKYTDTKEFKELNNDIDDDTQLSELSSDSWSESNLSRTPNNSESDLSESNLSSDI